MAAFVPPEPPRPGNTSNSGNQSPSVPPNYIPNVQNNAGYLADNLQNMNLNRPSNFAPRPSPFGQSPPSFGQAPPSFGQAPPPFLSSAMPPPGVPVSSPPFSRPGPPPGALGRPVMPPSAIQQATPPPGVPPARPTGPVAGQPSSVVFRPPPGPSQMMGGQVLPSALYPSSSSPSLGGTSAPSLAPTGLPSNGPPLSMQGALSSGLRYPSAINAPQPSVGPPPTRAPYQVPNMRTLPGAPIQPGPPFSEVPRGGSPPSGSPFAQAAWSMQQGQVATPIPGSLQPPRMYGMAPPLPNQSMTSISPAIPQTGSPSSGHSKIDPNQIPRPVPNSSIIMHDTRQAKQGNPPPPASSEYIVRDTGNCSPRFMRCTTCQIPCTADLLNTSGMQLALLIQPFALPHSSEEAVQVVDFGDSGPVRCSRCKAYINPFMKFIDQGKRFICNLCGFTDETPREYHCNLGPDGRRRDADERPELCRGTVEFVASKEYMVRDPMPAVYFFLIDVSMNALQTGATAAACIAINQVISDLPEGPRTMVGIATFDSTIHFYNLKRALQQPLMLIVPDVQDVYTPLQSDVIVQLSECRQHLQLLLESIPTMFQSNRTSESAFGAAIKAAFLAMKSTGGKLMVFQSVLPSTGIGALSAREAEGRTNISAGEKEAHKLLHPADKIYQNMATEFAEYQVCVDVFITTQNYVDIASISVIPRTTGGQVYYYHPFSALSDAAKLYNDLRWNVTRPQGFEAVMRVRCSQGIQVDAYHGNFCKRIPTDVDLPGIDSDKTIMVTLKHDDKLQDGSECAFQCALLYTTVYGQRRIRVSNLSLPCTSMLSNLFRAADLDTLFACFLKRAASEIPTTPLLQLHEHVINLSINVLLSYRKYCATVTLSGQLILPEALKLLPLYTLALIKSFGLRTDGRIDDRSFWISCVSSISTPLVVPFVYPRMIAIHELNSEKTDAASLPPVPLSSEHLSDEGIYLLENGEDCLIYLGKSVDGGILQQLFGKSSADEIPIQFVLQQYLNPLSQKLNDLVNEIRRERRSYLRLRICKKGDPSGMLFFSYMVEDKNTYGPSYVEFLVHIHRQIQMKMSS